MKFSVLVAMTIGANRASSVSVRIPSVDSFALVANGKRKGGTTVCRLFP